MRALFRLALAASLLVAAHAALARPIPENAELGKLELGVFPEAKLDGVPVRLGPGARIYDEGLRLVLPSTVTGVRRVAYQRGPMGEIVSVWLLTDEQARRLADQITQRKRQQRN